MLPKALAAATCGLTPPQTPGPFYPGEANFKPESDLTLVPGAPKRAEGQIIYIKGRVIDELCNPVANANVEIWQACSSGRYNNTKDPNPAPLDPNFRYWGEAHTDKDGNYMFKSIQPGAYPADTNWTRPPHIHFKISRLGYKELITQMYFAGDSLNEKDLILKEIPRSDWDRVIVDFRASAPDLEPGSLTGEFEITMKKVGS
jgi:protocatechuate 3,4-dioxygenase beta subunit